MTRHHTNTPSFSARWSFLRRLRNFFVVSMFVGMLGFTMGFGYTPGISKTLDALWRAFLVGLGAGALGCWIPLAIDYENHRFKWLYIVLFYLAEGLLLGIIGNAIAASLR